MNSADVGFEPLHPDLVPYFTGSDDLPMLRHPLVYSVPHAPHWNQLVNKQYITKQERISGLLEQGEWKSYIWMHERPYRLDAFLTVQDRLTSEEYWELLGSIWIDSENIQQSYDQWDQLLSATTGGSMAMMTPEEQTAFAALPDAIVVYQGHTSNRDDGWSWTTHRGIAVWFARRFARLENDEPMLTSAVVDKSDALAYFLRRNEYELLIDPQTAKLEMLTTIALDMEDDCDDK